MTVLILEKWEESVPDILLLDIQLNEENGIQTAKRVNEKWPECQIVYLTDYIYYATEVYNTTHIFYMLKTQFEERIGEMFDKVFHELAQKDKKLIFSLVGGKEVVLSGNEIFCFERIKRVTVIKTEQENYESRETIDDIVKRLPQLDFVRCHNSFIVYIPAIHETRKDCFVLANGENIPISRAYQNSARTAFLRWARTQIL